jgi:hypothetical protein
MLAWQGAASAEARATPEPLQAPADAAVAAATLVRGSSPAESAPSVPVPGDYTALIRDDHDRRTLYFTWSPAGMDRDERTARTWPENHYRICLFIGDSCAGATTRQVFDVTPAKGTRPPFRYRPADHGLQADLAFQETRFHWAIAACERNNGLCSDYSEPRAIAWTQQRLPVLLFPEHAATRDPMARTMFRWDATQDAEFYLLCLAKEGVSCPTRMVPRSDDLFVLVLPNTQRRAYLETLLNAALADAPLPPYRRVRLDGQKMYWSVAICRDGECRYQPNANSITFNRGKANIFIRNASRYDINEVWLAGPLRNQQALLTHDLSTYLPPQRLAAEGGRYDDDYLMRVARHHFGVAEPDVAPYYRVQYFRQRAGGTGTPVYERQARNSVSFAPGIAYLPDYTVERETLFIEDESTRFEQVLRGPDERRYLYRPGGSFENHPQAGPGPVLLQTLRDEGYNPY